MRKITIEDLNIETQHILYQEGLGNANLMLDEATNTIMVHCPPPSITTKPNSFA